MPLARSASGQSVKRAARTRTFVQQRIRQPACCLDHLLLAGGAWRFSSNMTTICSFTALPDDVLQRVLVGVLLDDHPTTAAACRAFRDVIRGPRFHRLRREYGFAERRVIIVCQRFPDTVEIHVAGKHRAVERVSERLHLCTFYTSTTDGGDRLFVSTTRTHGLPFEIFAVDASARRWSPFATLPLSQRLHCTEWHGGLLYVAGGKPEDFGASLNTLHAFNETTGLWQDLPQMPHACAWAASGVIGNELFIAGGRGVGTEDLSTLQIYDITARTYRLGAALPRTECGAWGIVGDGKLYLVSRPGQGQTRSILVYDVQSNTWTEQSPPLDEGGDVMYAFAHKRRIVVVYANGAAFHRGTGSQDWSRFDLDVAPAILQSYIGRNGVAGSVILG